MEGSWKFYGYEYEVSVYIYFRVAMDKRTDKDEIDERGFDATKNIYDHMTEIKVLDTQLVEFKQGKFYTFAIVGMDLRIKVVAHTHEQAYTEAEQIAKDVELPVGVVYYDCEAYDYETYHESVVGE